MPTGMMARVIFMQEQVGSDKDSMPETPTNEADEPDIDWVSQECPKREEYQKYVNRQGGPQEGGKAPVKKTNAGKAN